MVAICEEGRLTERKPTASTLVSALQKRYNICMEKNPMTQKLPRLYKVEHYGFDPVYQHVIDLPLQGPKGITLKNLVWPAAVRMAKRECTPFGKLLNRLDPSFRAARFRGLQTNADSPLHPPEVRLVFHLRSSDTIPLRDDFKFEDGNFYRREHPREGWSTDPVRWLMSVDYSIHKYAPVEDHERVKELEKAYQWFLRYGTPKLSP